MNKKITYIFILFLSISAIALFAAEEGKRVGEGVVLHPELTGTPPKIDGVLDDDAWKSGPLIKGPFIINRPVYGEILPQETEVWISYDFDNIYLAFYCHDNEPGKIKTSIARRDTIFNDDWIAVDLDSMGTQQRVYEHFCNPNGIQADALNTASSGEALDPDWVWYSAGKIVEDGYIVEMHIPLKSLKFKSGENVKMLMAIYRHVSRSGANSSWPQISQTKGYFSSLAPVVFGKLNRQLKLEALPSITYSNIRDRESPENWSPADTSTQLGIGVKYGITSSLNAELAINPDFSQVESDQFQVLTNQRYPIFYSEKRPFFMAVANQFNLAATSGEGNLMTAIHTRRIVDPQWGAKVTGEIGKASVGVLAAGDEWPGRPWEDDVNPYEGKNANFFIGRMKYGLKGDSYIGLLYSGMEFKNDYNRVIGGDMRFRLKGNHNIMFNGLYTFSRDPDTLEETQGGSFSIMYDYPKKNLDIFFLLDHFGKDFRMDTAFYFRTGITKATLYLGPKFYPDQKKYPWLKVINPILYVYYIRDHVTKMDDYFFIGGLRFHFPRQGMVRLDYRYHQESWAGQAFKKNIFRGFGGVQLSKWLRLDVVFDMGRAVYYDEDDPFLGDQLAVSLDASIQPNSKLTQAFSYTYERFNRLSGERVYDLNILISRTTWQFNKYLFARALVQYDSDRKVVLTDLLGSFTLIPGTVIHFGYGSLHRRQYYDRTNMTWEQQAGMGQYYQTTRTIFFKASYLYRF